MSRIYSLDQVCILLVEDNQYMAHLLGSMLKALRIGRVLRARDGVAAKTLIDWRVSAMSGQSIDIILSDWHMDPVDGLDLLKWVRSHPHDNVHVLPFIMLTASPELHRVRLARDAGVTAFLRKPVTVDSIVRRLREVIERPRPFVRTETYFGPDRRHQQLPFDGPERRHLQAAIVKR